jgi:hypothetical protein
MGGIDLGEPAADYSRRSMFVSQHKQYKRAESGVSADSDGSDPARVGASISNDGVGSDAILQVVHYMQDPTETMTRACSRVVDPVAEAPASHRPGFGREAQLEPGVEVSGRLVSKLTHAQRQTRNYKMYISQLVEHCSVRSVPNCCAV